MIVPEGEDRRERKRDSGLTRGRGDCVNRGASRRILSRVYPSGTGVSLGQFAARQPADVIMRETLILHGRVRRNGPS